MPRVFLPPVLRPLAGGLSIVDARGATVMDVLADVDQQYPGVRAALCVGNSLRAGISVTVNDAVTSLGLKQSVAPDAEIHFLPNLGGG